MKDIKTYTFFVIAYLVYVTSCINIYCHGSNSYVTFEVKLFTRNAEKNLPLEYLHAFYDLTITDHDIFSAKNVKP